MSSIPFWHGRILAVVGIVLFAFSLRTAVASLSPLYGEIAADFIVPATIVGLIGTAPPVCYAVFGILTPLLERRFGLERLAAAAMAVAAVGLVARGLAVDATTLLLATALTFAAVGVGNVLVPPLVKKYFPDRIGLMMTIYSTTMAVSTLVPPLVAVPIAEASSWRTSLGLWAVFALAATVPWIALFVRDRGAVPDTLEGPNPRVFGRLWRLPLAWALTVGFLVSSTIAYTGFAWLPTILVDIAGVAPSSAGTLLSLFAAMGLPASLLVPILVVRYRATRALFAMAVVAGFTAIGGFLIAPAAMPVLWVVLLGTTPLLFPMMLVLIGLRTRTHEGTVALSGFVQTMGYAIAAVVPFAIGVVHDATGSWTPAFWILAIVIAAAIPAGFIAGAPTTIEDEWERRHGAW